MLSPLLTLLGSNSREQSCSPLHHQVSGPALSCAAPSCALENSPPSAAGASWAILGWQMELGLHLSPSLPTQLGPSHPAEGEWLRHTAAQPLSAPRCGHSGLCWGRECHWGCHSWGRHERDSCCIGSSEIDISFFPTGESLRLPSDWGREGGVAVLLCRFSL